MKNYKNQKTVAVIPARGRSKRFPRKNIQLLAGKPLIWYAIEEAKKSKFIDEFFVSTEDKEIKEIAETFGAPIIPRPLEFATDDCPPDSPFKQAIEYLKFDGNLIVLQPCSPLRTVEDIDGTVEKFYQWEPSILVTLGPDGEYNGAIYIYNTRDYKKVNYNWKELTYLDPYVYLMTARKSKANIHYKKDLKEAEELIEMKDEDYYKYTFEDHLKKENQHKDRIGMVKEYLSKKEDLESLRKRDKDLYEKLRDNPERIGLILTLSHGEKCLDIGCSDGILSIELAKAGCRYIEGIDIRGEAIDNANKLKSELPLDIQEKIRFRVATPQRLLREGKKFDTIYLTEVLEHIYFTHHDKILNSIISLMKPSSNLIVSVPNRYPKKIYEQRGRSRWKFEGHVACFSKLSLEDFLSKYFSEIEFHTLPKNQKPQEGVFLVCNCKKLLI